MNIQDPLRITDKQLGVLKSEKEHPESRGIMQKVKEISEMTEYLKTRQLEIMKRLSPILSHAEEGSNVLESGNTSKNKSGSKLEESLDLINDNLKVLEDDLNILDKRICL